MKKRYNAFKLSKQPELLGSIDLGTRMGTRGHCSPGTPSWEPLGQKAEKHPGGRGAIHREPTSSKAGRACRGGKMGWTGQGCARPAEPPGAG